MRRVYRYPLYVRARYGPPLGTRPPIDLAICAIFRDEARYLAEWVAFHRLQGATRFYLYDNLSTDDWEAAIGEEIASGIVEATSWPHVPGQLEAYDDCLVRHRNHARWIAFLDIDEFLFSPTGRRVTDILHDFDTHPGVLVNWRMYGTNGRTSPPDGLVIESYPMRAADNYFANALTKSIVYPRMALGCRPDTVHYFRLRGNPVGEDGHPALKQTREPPTADLLRINHYYAKSDVEFERKSLRPNARDGVVIERFPMPPAEVHDDSIRSYGEKVKAILPGRPSNTRDTVVPDTETNFRPAAS
jgi:Glycosyltransferase family 92